MNTMVSIIVRINLNLNVLFLTIGYKAHSIPLCLTNDLQRHPHSIVVHPSQTQANTKSVLLVPIQRRPGARKEEAGIG